MKDLYEDDLDNSNIMKLLIPHLEQKLLLLENKIYNILPKSKSINKSII